MEKKGDFPQKQDCITVCPPHILFEMNPSPHTRKFPQFYYNPLPCEIPINCISQKQRIFYQILMRRTAITTPFAQAHRPSSLATIVVVVSRTLACAPRVFSLSHSLGAIVIVVSRLPSRTLQDEIDVVFG
jgi:hypothetical protein